jgi:hypothetical protein
VEPFAFWTLLRSLRLSRVRVLIKLECYHVRQAVCGHGSTNFVVSHFIMLC